MAGADRGGAIRRRWREVAAAVRARAGAGAGAAVCVCACSGRICARRRRGSGIRILGDVAIFVNMDSADVWVHPEHLRAGRGSEADSHRRRAAGLFFADRAALGQSAVSVGRARASAGFDWWIDRIRRSRELYDIVRLDHFRGFEAYWSIPAEEETAINGKWVKAPGLELFRRAGGGTWAAAAGGRGSWADHAGGGCAAAGTGDAGDEGAAVRIWRQGRAHSPAAPVHAGNGGVHRHARQRHDAGWWETLAKTERAAVEALVGPVNDRPAWPLIRAAAASVAEMAIVPVQDLLELGSEARMNTPAVAAGQLELACAGGSWTAELAARLAAIVEVTDRDNDPLQAARMAHRAKPEGDCYQAPPLVDALRSCYPCPTWKLRRFRPTGLRGASAS